MHYRDERASYLPSLRGKDLLLMNKLYALFIVSVDFAVGTHSFRPNQFSNQVKRSHFMDSRIQTTHWLPFVIIRLICITYLAVSYAIITVLLCIASYPIYKSLFKEFPQLTLFPFYLHLALIFQCLLHNPFAVWPCALHPCSEHFFPPSSHIVWF